MEIRMNLSVDEILNQVKAICRKYKVSHAYLFGSYATGSQTPTSDIDIVIKGGENLDALMEEIEDIPTLKTIDIFVYEECTNPYLKEDMDRYAQQLY